MLSSFEYRLHLGSILLTDAMQRAARPFRCLPARRASFLVDPFGDGALHAKMKIAVGAVGQKGFPVMAITVTNERGEVVLCVAKAPRLTGGAARLVTLKKPNGQATINNVLSPRRIVQNLPNTAPTAKVMNIESHEQIVFDAE